MRKGRGRGTSWVVKEIEEGLRGGRGGGSGNKETAMRRHNTRCEASQERVFIFCCDKVKAEHLEKHIGREG